MTTSPTRQRRYKPVEPKTKFGAALMRWRKERGFSRAEAAAELRVSKDTIDAWERIGMQPTRYAICKRLGELGLLELEEETA